MAAHKSQVVPCAYIIMGIGNLMRAQAFGWPVPQCPQRVAHTLTIHGPLSSHRWFWSDTCYRRHNTPNMTSMHRFFIAGLLMAALGGCTPYQSLMKEGAVFESGGLNRDALSTFEEAWEKSGRAEARTSMRRVAQQMLNQQLSQARMACLAGEYERALAEYEQAFAFETQWQSLEISAGALAIDSHRECRTSFVNDLYRQAEEAVLKEEFDVADRIIDKLLRFDRNHKEAQYLSILCDVIPNYRSGQLALSLGQYRDAWVYFNEVCLLDPAYKDALELRALCAEKARVVLAYIPIETKGVSAQLVKNLSTAIKSAMLAMKNPFLQLVEREDLDQVLAEQLQGMQGTYSAEDAVAAGELLGARYLLTGEITSYTFNAGSRQGGEQKGYTSSLSKITYMQYRRVNRLEATYRYKIVDAQSGRIYAAETIPFSLVDESRWAEYNGDTNGIIPGNWRWKLVGSEQDRIDYDKRDQLQALFAGARYPMTEAEMQQRLIAEVSQKIAHTVSVFQP